jgi:hypothetical protein
VLSLSSGLLWEVLSLRPDVLQCVPLLPLRPVLQSWAALLPAERSVLQ